MRTIPMFSNGAYRACVSLNGLIVCMSVETYPNRNAAAAAAMWLARSCTL